MALSQLFSQDELEVAVGGIAVNKPLPAQGMSSYHVVNQTGLSIDLMSDDGQRFDSVTPFTDVVGFFPQSTNRLLAVLAAGQAPANTPDFPIGQWTAMYELAGPEVAAIATRTPLRSAVSNAVTRQSVNLDGSPLTYIGPVSGFTTAEIVPNPAITGLVIIVSPPPAAGEVSITLRWRSTQIVAFSSGVSGSSPVVVPLPILVEDQLTLVVTDSRVGARRVYVAQSYDTISVYPNSLGPAQSDVVQSWVGSQVGQPLSVFNMAIASGQLSRLHGFYLHMQYDSYTGGLHSNLYLRGSISGRFNLAYVNVWTDLQTRFPEQWLIAPPIDVFPATPWEVGDLLKGTISLHLDEGEFLNAVYIATAGVYYS